MEKIEFGRIVIGNVAKEHILDCLDRNFITEGPKVKLFERNWGKLFNYKYNVAVSSGTSACLNACLALYDIGAKVGDEIIVPALGFIATSNAVRAAGFTPRWVDVEKETLNINPNLIENAINSKTKAIFVVHTMGRPCEMDIICDIAKKHNLIVIEDCCESPAAKYKNKLVGHWGDMACFSFYAAHLICTGEGGMVSTNREDLFNILTSTKSHGRSGLYFDHPRFGLNSKMNDLEASIGLEGITEFWNIFWKRKSNINRFRNELYEFENKIWFSEEDKGNTNCPHAFSLTFKESGKLIKFGTFLEEKKIHWKRNFGCIPTQHGSFSYMNYKIGDFPNSEYIGTNGLHIGCHQFLDNLQIEYIINILKTGLANL